MILSILLTSFVLAIYYKHYLIQNNGNAKQLTSFIEDNQFLHFLTHHMSTHTHTHIRKAWQMSQTNKITQCYPQNFINKYIFYILHYCQFLKNNLTEDH